MAELLVHTVDIANATISIRRAGSITSSGVKEEASGPGEFSLLTDCYARDGIIRPRRRLIRPTNQPSSLRILSMGEFKNGETRDTWLLTSWMGETVTRKVAPTAMLFTRSGNTMAVTVKRQGHKAYPPGVPFSFWTYRNMLWASNGWRSQVFDGRAWSDLNGTNNNSTEIAARIGGVAESKMFMANTPTYPDEWVYADVLMDLPVTTKWTGVGSGIGTSVGVPLNCIVSPSTTYGLFAVGGSGTILRATSETASWFQLQSPTPAGLYSVALLLHNTDDLDGFMVGPNYLAGEVQMQNAWRIHYDDPDSDPVITREVVNGILDLYAVVIDPAYSSYTDPWRYAVVGGSTGGTTNSRAEIRQWDGDKWSGYVYTTHAGAEVRDIAIISDGSTYHRYACGTFDSNGNAVMLKEGLVVAARWDDIAAFPDLTKKSVDLNGLHGFGVGGQHTLFVVGQLSSAGKVYRYQSDGTWSTLAMPTGYEYYTPKHVLALSRTTVYVVGERGLIMKSTDAGANWAVQTSGVSIQLNRIVNFDTTDLLKLAAVGDNGAYLYTVDGGTTWIVAGEGEYSPNKMVNAGRFGSGESIRAKYQRSGMVAFFTNRGIRVVESAGMKRQFDLDGFETFNDNCIAEFRGGIVMLGKMDGTPGIYGWDGSASPPRLLSESVTGLFRSSPGNNYIPCLRCIPDTSDHIYDTEDDFRPRTEAENHGWAFNPSYWDYKNGLMTMRMMPQSVADTTILSHGISGAAEPTETNDTGIYVPNVSDWGFISFDYTLNHPASEGDVGIELWVRTAAAEIIHQDGTRWPASWTSWKSVTTLTHTGQDIRFGRDTLLLNSSDAPAANKWLQFKLVCKNHAKSDFNVIINRVILRAFADTDSSTLITAPAPPSLVAHDDRIEAHFSVDTVTETPRFQPRCVVLSGDKLQATTIATGTEVSCGLVSNDELFLGLFGRDSSNPYNLLFSLEDSGTPAADAVAIAQELRFFIDFSGADAKARTLPKDLLRLHISARPADYNGDFSMTVKWASDDIYNLPASGKKLAFNRRHQPEGDPSVSPRVPKLRHHTLELGAASLSANNSGKRFHFVLTGSSAFILEAMQVEALVRPPNWATAYEGT